MTNIDATVKVRNIAALVIGVVCIVCTGWALSQFFAGGGQGNMAVMGVTCFRYFTVDSNILAAIACAALIPFQVRAIRTGVEMTPRWALLLKFAGTAAVTVTLVVVLGFLGPTMGYGMMFVGPSFFMHGLTPVLCILSLTLLERGEITRRELFWAVLPVLVYGSVYMVMVVALGPEAGGWPDFYGFNVGGLWPVSFVACTLVNLLIGVLERLPHRPVAELAAKRAKAQSKAN